MSVVSVKVPRWVKEKMRRHSQSVNWPEEIRRLIIQRLEELERAKALERVKGILEKMPTTPKGAAERLVRLDREGH